MTMSDAESEKLFNEITQFIADSRALLQQGAFMELTGLDTQVTTLCEAVLKMTGDERQRYAKRLDEMLAELKLLVAEMTVQRDKMAKDIFSLGDHQKANIAYSTADKRDKEKK